MSDLTCAFDECDNKLDKPYRRGQKYCSIECTKKANNKRAMERYRRRKALLGQDGRRVCATPGCTTLLRRTSFEDYCEACRHREEFLKKERVRRRILNGEDTRS